MDQSRLVVLRDGSFMGPLGQVPEYNAALGMPGRCFTANDGMPLCMNELAGDRESKSNIFITAVHV